MDQKPETSTTGSEALGVEKEEGQLSGAVAFCEKLVELNSADELERVIAVQTQIYSKFEKCNEKFTTFNDLCAANYATTSQRFKRHTQLLVEAKKDLDSIFRRIRVLKSKLAAQYPEAYAHVASQIEAEEDGEEEEQREGILVTNRNEDQINPKSTDTTTAYHQPNQEILPSSEISQGRGNEIPATSEESGSEAPTAPTTGGNVDELISSQSMHGDLEEGKSDANGKGTFEVRGEIYEAPSRVEGWGEGNAEGESGGEKEENSNA